MTDKKYAMALKETKLNEEPLTGAKQGPPGTGKTRLIGFCVLNCVQQQQRWLLTAETHYAVQVCADRIYANLQAVDGNYNGIWLIERADLDSAAFTVSSSDFPDDQAKISELTRTKIIQRLRGMRSPNGSLLPLTSQIASDFSETNKECEPTRLQFLEISMYHNWPSTTLVVKRMSFDKVWEDTQEYYIRTQALGIIVTAATAMTKMLRVFRPQQIIVNEASQLTEFATVAVVSRFFENLRKVLIVGDPCQKKPFVLNQNSEFVNTTETSLMVRLSNSGVPITRLREQFRMHPHIAQPVSSLSYEATLINSPSVLSRPKDRIWQTFHGQTLQECAKRHSIFVHVKNYVPYRLKKTQSMLKPSRLAIVRALIDR
ncbi:hypothetical protein HO133_008868 [Letharia lupina]|uniref:DNA2/NAM7 helicase helicase domain-containing protein n=1 Tax=Letharia lupina TaxID=560253 RepID=A0A8H6CQ38_9LECA|nr:uncharacterized protein HO133_008868 [Letharia lupina]KAF6227424.1 hypothetical protein HO133_008868 [Letharia lupina]